jgi:hypothetical protein
LCPPVVLSTEEQVTCDDFARSITSELRKLKTPNSEDNVWIGPFDQLVSCGYAIVQAANRGFIGRETERYYDNVFVRIVKLLGQEEHENSELVALNNYVSSFYFNAGIQRLVFAAERLIATFVGVYCDCGKEPLIVGHTTPRWPVLLSVAQCRLEHPHFDSSMPHLRKMLSCASDWHTRCCDRDKCIAILRDQVNPKKHGIYDRAWILAHRPTGSDGGPWSPTDQLRLAEHGFEIVCNAYSEVVAWNPKPWKKQ